MYDELDEHNIVDQTVVNAVLLKLFQMVKYNLEADKVQYHVDDIETVFNRCFTQDKYSFVHDLFMTGDAICDYGLCNEIWTTDKPASDVEKVRKLFKAFDLCVCDYDTFCRMYKCYGICGNLHLVIYLYLFHIAQMMS